MNNCCDTCLTLVTSHQFNEPDKRCGNPSCECHMNNEHEWKKELHTMLDKNIAVDGGAVATKYYHELVDFISSERQKAYEEGVRDVKDDVWEKPREKIMFEAGRQAAYTELLAELPKEESNEEQYVDVGVRNKVIRAIRDLIEKKRV